MISFQQIPGWILILAALATAGLFGWRYMYLLAPWRRQRYVLGAVLFGAAVLLMIGLVKRNSVNHAMLLLVDTMAGFLVASIPIGQDVRYYRDIATRTGTLPPFKLRHVNSTVFTLMGAASLLIIVEYALTYQW